MKQADQTLLEQMRMTEFELEYRKALCCFTQADAGALRSCRPLVERNVDELVELFYRSQTNVAEIALLIGDADTLARLKNAQRRYVLELFGGVYDLDYVHNRLRIGLVHRRIGVEPKLYLSAMLTLKVLLRGAIAAALHSAAEREAAVSALDKLLFIDTTLVFETYIRSLVAEIETAKDESERYARTMEDKVKERTAQLEELSRTDALTGLLNVRALEEVVTTTLRHAERRGEPVAAAYFDVDDFKSINDSEGHQRGDDVLRLIGRALKSVARAEDSCFRCGGDEFCVILSNCRAEDAQERFIARLTAALQVDLVDVTISCGVAQTGPTEYVSARSLIHQADENMFAAKQPPGDLARSRTARRVAPSGRRSVICALNDASALADGRTLARGEIPSRSAVASP